MNPRDALATLTDSKRGAAFVGLLIVVAAVGGAFAVGILGVPSVAAVDNTFGNVTDETTEVKTDLVVSNPNPIGVGLDGVSVNYTVSMNDIEMARDGREGVSVGTGNSTVPLETDLRNDAIPSWWVSHVRNDERTTVDIDANVTSGLLGRSVEFSQGREVTTDLLGAFNSEETRPVNADSADRRPDPLRQRDAGRVGERQRGRDADRHGVHRLQPEHRTVRRHRDRLRCHDERCRDGLGTD